MPNLEQKRPRGEPNNKLVKSLNFNIRLSKGLNAGENESSYGREFRMCLNFLEDKSWDGNASYN